MQLEVIAREPAADARSTPLLFVHGMWHAAWCWAEHFLPYLAQRGFPSYALSLRGHGASAGRERLRWASLAEYVSDVAWAVEQMERPPVLVGHSMGGMVVQKYLESHRVPAAVLLASAPPRGLVPATLRILRRRPLPLLKATLTLRLVQTIGTPALYREAFFSPGFSGEELAVYHARVQDESLRAYVDMLALDLPHPKRVETPLLVLGSRDDRLIAPAEVAATAQAYQTHAEFFAGLGHAMMLDVGWQAVAERILDWLDDQAL